MARRPGRRDTYGIANDPLSDLVGPLAAGPGYTMVEDLRRHEVEVSPISRTVGGVRSRIVPAAVARTRRDEPVKAFKVYNQMAFEKPRGVLVCVRRQMRKEVILAKGKGGAKHRRPRRGQWSHVQCRRK